MFSIKGIHSGSSRRDFLAGTAAIGLAALAGPVSFGADSAVAAEFAVPPNPYRMRMHWYIFGPAWNTGECERQLRLMAAAHIGGVLIFPTYPIALDDPQRGIKNQEYLSPEFLETFRSVTEICRRLGLTVDIVLGTGWPYGGPSVSLDDCAKSIRRRQVPVTVREAIPLPVPGPSERLVGVFHVDGRNVTDLSQEAGAAGTAIPPSARGELQLFLSTPTRMQVKRASLGAEGWVLDHYNEAALQRYLAAVGDQIVGSVPRGAIRSIFCDSLEVYRATWTERLPEVFRDKRGYDIVAHLPALFDSAFADSRDLRCDFWRTLSELAFEQFVAPLQKWAHARGVTTQVEAYGTPPVSIAAYQAVDIPVGEHYEWKEFSSSRWASSGGHLAGKPVILAEAWTWAGLPNRFADTLEQLKLCSDLHFLSGINALYGVTYAYSPIEMGSPGWVPYFGPSTNHTSPYWPHFPHFADYVNRATYVLQQGKPVADVALYLPVEDAMAEASIDQLLLNWAVRDRLSSNGPPPEFRLNNALHYEADVVKTIITNGYAFDGVDTFTMRDMRAEHGRLRMGDGDYAAVVLPNLTAIDRASLSKIAEFVRLGGTVIATRRLPETAWGRAGRDGDRAQVKALVAGLFGNVPRAAALHENAYGRGKAIFAADELGSLRQALGAIAPDVRFLEPSGHVSFVHRRAEDRDFYFLANTSDHPQRLDATFRTGGRVPECWDLKTGEQSPVVVFQPGTQGCRLRFELGPFESRVYVFSEGRRKPVAFESDLAVAATAGGWKAQAFENGSFSMRGASGVRQLRVAGLPAPFLLSGPWQLRLEGTSVQFSLVDLRSWTEMPEARFFSGRGVYECRFRLPEAPGPDTGVVLDLGSVHETAAVILNGKPAGVAWMRPYCIEVAGLLRTGENTLRVEVTNLLINKVLGMGPIDYSAVFQKYGQRFPAGDEWQVIREPLVSGLLGPVRLRYARILRGA